VGSGDIPPELDDDRITAMGLLLEATAAVREATEPTFQRFGLSPQWAEVLLRLSRTPGHRLRMSELASSMTSITPSGLTRVVDRMVDEGLVEREQCQEDRRGAFAVATEAGIERIRRAMAEHVDDVDRVLTGLFTPSDLAALTGMLRTIRDSARPAADGAG
jgi:MarR family transcriptional regulator, 2-MHQ and catechol-resistance regulon repressor